MFAGCVSVEMLAEFTLVAYGYACYLVLDIVFLDRLFEFGEVCGVRSV